ncbi:MAG: hypothetical protein ED557_00910 [Balneola sp.]|nr:MAG: hypothetical protein ED557_00910 [Balneola sp.]
MDSNRAPFRFRWTLGFFVYLILTLVSVVFIQLNSTLNSKYKLVPYDGEKPVLLFFNDPILDVDFSETNIEDEFFVLSPDYRNVKNPSFHSISEYAKHLIDSLNIASVHVGGKGIGGAVATEFSYTYPERVSSTTLMSANGVVELELLGGYHLNHAVYSAKYLGYSLFKFLTPNFGMFESVDRQILRAKIQRKSDQRELRGKLGLLSGNVLIQHIEGDKISYEASKEHSRIIPQSELKSYPINSSSVNQDFYSFLTRNEFQQHSSPAISASRKIQSLLPFDETNSVKAEGRALIILMLVIILSTLISEDLTCIGTGLLIARGLIGFGPGVLACLIGIFVGDILLYLSGKWLASSTLHRAPLKWFINEKDIQKSYHWFEARGPAIIIASRFIPGTRFPTYFSAGAIGASFWMFIFYFGVASIIWTPILVGLAVLLGQEMINYFNVYQDYALWVLGGVLVTLYLIFKILIPFFTFKGRRLLIGKWKRLTQWEFWSPFVIYSFVVLYSFWLWVKYKRPGIFVHANPAIPYGGFIKESKHDILNGIKDRDSVARYSFIRASMESKKEAVIEFMKENALEYPIVIKPDIGERGKGVQIVKDEAELDALIPTLESDHILQEFIPGEEFGVFYYRFPNETKGRILSITRKKYLSLIGDGVHTLEELILKDKRAVCMAEVHFDNHIDKLYSIPAKEEKITLVELGTHARGAIFYDASNLLTDELRDELDRISSSFDGFHFGRYDIKVPTESDLKLGKNLKVIELNGVTSESTNIYDPSHSFFFGVKTLINQWKIAYEIGHQVKKSNPDLNTPSLVRMLSLLS